MQQKSKRQTGFIQQSLSLRNVSESTAKRAEKKRVKKEKLLWLRIYSKRRTLHAVSLLSNHKMTKNTNGWNRRFQSYDYCVTKSLDGLKTTHRNHLGCLTLDCSWPCTGHYSDWGQVEVCVWEEEYFSPVEDSQVSRSPSPAQERRWDHPKLMTAQ